MTRKTVNNILIILIIVFSLIVSSYGFFSNKNVYEDKTFLSLNDEIVSLYGKGLYYNDSISMASQFRAQDIVTLIIGLPILIVSFILFNRNSLKGKLLLTGTIGYFLYTYVSYSFLAAYNKLFLIYVALMSLSLFCFIINFTSSELKDIKTHFSPKFPRKYIAISSVIMGIFICFLWLSMIISSINKVPHVLEHYTTLVIQALDLGFIVPLSILSGILLLLNKSLGYLLSPVIIIKGVTLLLAITMMAIFQVISGVNVSIIELIMFPLFAMICIINMFLILRSIE